MGSNTRYYTVYSMQNKFTSWIRTKQSNSFRSFFSSKSNWLYVLGLLLFFALRIVSIQSIPSVISHDEIYYPAEAKAIAVSGHDPSGTWVPWSLTSAHPLYAELPGLVMTPAAMLFSDPIMAARATHIVIGTLFCAVLAWFTYTLTKNKKIASIVFLLAGLNPWLFQFSRMGFDALLSLFFYFLGITVYLHYKGYKKLWSLPLLFIGFFQYQGLKVIFVPLVLATVVYDFFSEHEETMLTTLKHFLTRTKKNYLPAIIMSVFAILVFGTYMIRLSSQAAGERTSDLIFSDSEYTITHTNRDRQQSLASPLNTYFINKGTVIFDRFVSQYFESFSWHHLFITGEPLRNPFSVWKHGMFYLADILLIALGIVYLIKNKNYHSFGWYLLVLALVAPLAGALSAKGSWIMFRSSLLVPVFLVTASFGAYYLLAKFPRFLGYLVILVYALFVARFFFLYFYSYPIIGTQGEYFSERVVANYIHRNPDANVVVYASEPRFMFESILVFNGLITAENIQEINTAYQNKEYSLKNFTVINRCYQPSENQNVISIVHQATPTCGDSQQNTDKEITVQIPSLIDSGAIYTVYNDQLCRSYGLGRFSHITKNVFAVEKQTTEVYCTSFFTQN